jgi:hypothetical protein
MNLRSLLKQVPATAYLYGLLGVALIGAYQGWAYHQREIGRREVELAQSASELRAAKMRADSLEKVYRVDTLRLTKIKRVTDSLTVTVEQWKTDTLKVVEYVAKADTAIKACVQALGTCEARVGAERAGRLAAEKQTAILKAQMPGNLARCGVSVGAGAVWSGGRVAAGPAVTVGCKIAP